ncbi:acetyltransferase [Xylaria sp. FL1042]|nr:acetyltransferase [Xylaria sp. FL1042]
MATQTNGISTPTPSETGVTTTTTIAPHTIPPTAIFVTSKCYLRRYELSDAEPQAIVANDAEIVKYMRSRFPHPYTLADSQSFIEHCRALEAPALSFAILTLDGELAGSMSLEPPKGDPIYAGTRELGYWSARKFWGRGIITEAVRELTRWAFANVPELLRIEAAVFESNKASQRVLEKAGFTKEGTRRLAAVKNGEQINEVMFGLIRSDVEA